MDRQVDRQEERGDDGGQGGFARFRSRSLTSFDQLHPDTDIQGSLPDCLTDTLMILGSARYVHQFTAHLPTCRCPGAQVGP